MCDLARGRVKASDGANGAPCVLEVQRADGSLRAPYQGGPQTRTGEAFVLHTYRGSGRYRVAVQCAGYAVAESEPFVWELRGLTCGACAELVTITVTALPQPDGVAPSGQGE